MSVFHPCEADPPVAEGGVEVLGLLLDLVHVVLLQKLLELFVTALNKNKQTKSDQVTVHKLIDHTPKCNFQTVSFTAFLLTNFVALKGQNGYGIAYMAALTTTRVPSSRLGCCCRCCWPWSRRRRRWERPRCRCA